MEDNQSNRLKKKIEQAIRRTGFDENFISAIMFHLDIIEKKWENPNLSPMETCNLMLSKHFIDKMDSYPTGRFRRQINEYSGWPVTPLPSELFGDNKLSVDYRKSRFYFCLQTGDVLDCRVSSISPTEYQLRVIHKYGIARMLDDLNITVVMARSQDVCFLLEKDLLLCDLVRVTVLVVEKLENETKVFVTVVDDKNLKPLGQNLGRISEEQLQSYVLYPPDFPPDSTYSDYLNNLTAFRNPLSLNKVLEGFGLDPYGTYSFYPVDESLTPVNGNALVKESKLDYVTLHTNESHKEIKKGNLQRALGLIKTAIEVYPMKDLTKTDMSQLSELYERRGNILLDIEKPRLTPEIVKIWKNANGKDPIKDRCRRQLANSSFSAAMRLYRKKEYKEAADLAKISLQLQKTNLSALTLLEHLREKHQEVFNDLEDESLTSLQKKRQELIGELIKQGVIINPEVPGNSSKSGFM